MPAKHERKIFIPSGVYHIFNRGVNKKNIFHDPSDYLYFVECIFVYLLPRNQLMTYLISENYSDQKIRSLISRSAHVKNYSDKISLYAYCLMPNHFHLLLRQNEALNMSSFIKSLLTRYSMRYAKKYDHIGPIFQGRYKAILVANSVYFRIVINYIHQNPADSQKGSSRAELYPWSSLKEYNDPTSKKLWLKKARSF